MIRKSLFLFLLLALVSTEVYAARVAIILSEKNRVFQIVADGAVAAFSDLDPSTEVRIFTFSRQSNAKTMRKQILDYYPDANFAIGRPAADLCSSMTLFPYIFTLVLNPTKAGLVDATGRSTGYSTGIKILISPYAQFKEIKKSVPSTQVVGCLYSYDTADLIEKAKLAASKLDLTLETEVVSGLNEVSTRFRQLAKRGIDSYWLIVDTKVLSKDTLDYLIHSCSIREINFLTFNPNHVKVGASIAVYLDYPGLGKQGAEVALEVLRGSKINDIPIADAKYTKSALHGENVFYRGRS